MGHAPKSRLAAVSPKRANRIRNRDVVEAMFFAPVPYRRCRKDATLEEMTLPLRSPRHAGGESAGSCEAHLMKNEAVIDGITVGGQPDASELAGGRFQTVVNIRLDDEPGNATAALLAGSDIAYTSVPWTIDTVTADDIARIRAAVEAAEGPVLIH